MKSDDLTKKAYFPAPKGTPPAIRPDLVLPIVSDKQVDDVAFVRAVRDYAYFLTSTYSLTPALWRPFLVTAYQDFGGCFQDKHGNEMMLNTDLLEVDEALLFKESAQRVTRANEALRERFETLCCVPCKAPRFRSLESREFFKVVASILTTLTVQDALFVALKVKAANDNFPQA